MSDLATQLRKAREDVSYRQGQRQTLLDMIARLEQRATGFEREAEQLRKAIEVLQVATETRRQELKDRVESLVTRGLRAVFNREDYEFGFAVQLKRDVFGVTPVLRSHFKGQPMETSIVDGHGGGIADVVSFLLRVVVLCLARPRVAPFMALDEVFRHVSPEFLRGCATLLKELNTSAGIQFLIVTHKPELLDAADVVYRTEFSDGLTSYRLEQDMRDDLAHARPKRGAVAEDRATLFDHQDMLKPENDAPVEYSTTTDFLAERLRAKRPTKKRKARGDQSA